jgi:hypothetical protein
MLLTRSQLVGALATGNVPIAAWVGAGDSIQGDRFGTVSRAWLTATWCAAIDSLRANIPGSVESRAIGSSGASQSVPRYILHGYSCRNQTLLVYAHGIAGFVTEAVKALPSTLDHDSLAFGFLHYTARPRSENLNRDGRHMILWFIDHDGVFQTFEPGDGEENEMTAEELASITFIFAH